MLIQRVAIQSAAHAAHEVRPIQSRAAQSMEKKCRRSICLRRRGVPIEQGPLTQQSFVSIERPFGPQHRRHDRRLRRLNPHKPRAPTMRVAPSRTAKDVHGIDSESASSMSYQYHGVRTRHGSSHSIDFPNPSMR